MPKTIVLELFWTKDARNKAPGRPPINAVDVAKRYVEDTKDLFKYYGIEVRTTPSSTDPTPGRILPWPTTINLPEHDSFVRRMAQESAPNQVGLPVIFATLNEASRADLSKDGKTLEILGWVPDEPVVMKAWPKNFVFFNMLRHSSLGYPLPHELGHAAGLEHELDDANNIMFPGPTFSTNNFTPKQLDTIGKAYFVTDK